MVTNLVDRRAVSLSFYRSIITIRLFCCLALLAAFVLPAAADTPIYINGQFNLTSSLEATTLKATTPQNGDQVISGTGIPLWTVTGSVDWISALWNVPPGAGGWSVDLNGSKPDKITTTVELDPGQYLLSFYLTGDPRLDSSQRSVNVIVGSASHTFTVTPSAPVVDLSVGTIVNWGNLDWTLETLKFSVRAGTRSTIAFQSLTANDPVVGNVSVTKTGEVPIPVPEAGFYSAFAINLAGLLLLVRRRRSGGFPSQYCSSGKWRKLRKMKQLCGVAS